MSRKKKQPDITPSTRVKLKEVLKNSDKFDYKDIEESVWSDIPYFIPIFPWLDYAIAGFEPGRVGGIPAQRLTEIYGPESSGKSTLADLIIASVQRMDGYGIIADFEDAHQERRMIELGVDPDYTTFINPKERKDGSSSLLSLEDYFDGTEDAVKRIRSEDPSGPIVAVLDAVASAHLREHVEDVTKEDIAEYDSLNMNASTKKAKWLSQNLTKFVGRMSRRNVTMIFINQLREQPGVMFGNPEYAPGGKTIPYTASLIIGLSKGTRVDQDKDLLRKHKEPDPIALDGTFKIIKNKVAKVVKPGSYRLYFDDRAIVPEENFFYMIKERKVADRCEELERVGNSWSWKGERIGKSEKEVVNLLVNNQELFKEMNETIYGETNAEEENKEEKGDDAT